MQPLKMSIIPIALLTSLVVGCGRGQTPIPPGAQVVHVVATESEVRLDPASVQAGDVYLVLDEPVGGSFSFVERKRTAAETPGPLGDDDLERLAQGDTEGTSIGSFSIGCDAAQQAEDRGQMGYCGNVWKVSLVEGKYADPRAGLDRAGNRGQRRPHRRPRRLHRAAVDGCARGLAVIPGRVWELDAQAVAIHLSGHLARSTWRRLRDRCRPDRRHADIGPGVTDSW